MKTILFLLLCGSAVAIFRAIDPDAYVKSRQFDEFQVNSYSWIEEYLNGVAIDHFSFTNPDTFKLRYFINTTFYTPGGPILFYTGNEGVLEGFARNTGFMWDLAPELKGAVVFCEHRFYGKSKPFGNSSYSSIEKLGYLTSEQALADFVVLIDYLKSKRIPNASKSPVIAFGGSYGGMLSAWLRIKYPHKVAGAIAASAPVFWFIESKIPEDIYSKIVTRAFVDAGCMFEAINTGWTSLRKMAATDDGRQQLNRIFKLSPESLIEKPEDYKFLVAYIREVFESMAMVNYPYPSNFLSPLPGWPVKEACKYFSKLPASDSEAAHQMYMLVNLYYNYTGTMKYICANEAKCPGAYSGLGDPLGWPWQACTEMLMPQCSNGPPSDFFTPTCPFRTEEAAAGCKQLFGAIGYKKSLLNPTWQTQNYGTFFPTASNIVFSNGYLDPWSGGGWSLKNEVKGTLISIILQQGAHHYDLRGAHPNDTEEVKKVRLLEKSFMKQWFKEWRYSGY